MQLSPRALVLVGCIGACADAATPRPPAATPRPPAPLPGQVAASASPPPSWRWVHPRPQGNPLLDVAAHDGAVYAVGRGTVVRSLDAGDSWNVLPIAQADLAGVWVAPDGAVIAVGDDGRAGLVMTSRDQGRTWTRRSFPEIHTLFDVWGAEATVYAAGWDGALLRSLDGGDTWVRRASGTDESLVAIDGTSPEIVRVLTVSGRVRTTRDGGTSWREQRAPGRNYFYGLWIDSEDRMHVAGASGVLHRSSADGRRWTRMRHPARGADMLGLGGAGPMLFAWGNLTFLVSEDDGTSWSERQPSQRVRAALGVEIAGATRLIAVGDRGSVFTSDDRGVSWRRHGDDLGGVFVDVGGAGDRVAAVGHDRKGGVILEKDAAHWRRHDGGWSALWGVHGGAGRLYAVGEQGAVLRSEAVGHWQRVETGTRAGLRAVCVAPSGTVYVAGEQVVLRSRDAGESWTAVHDFAGTVWALACPTDERVLAVGAPRLALRSDDGGDTWHPIVDLRGATSGLMGVWAARDGRFAAAAMSAQIITGGDGPVRFHATGRSEPLMDVWEDPGGALHVVGAGGAILRRDGATWIAHDIAVDAKLFGIWGRAADDIYAVGEGGAILHFGRHPR